MAKLTIGKTQNIINRLSASGDFSGLIPQILNFTQSANLSLYRIIECFTASTSSISKLKAGSLHYLNFIIIDPIKKSCLASFVHGTLAYLNR